MGALVPYLGWILGVFGAFMLLIALAGLFKIDESWRPQSRSCCRCHNRWFGTAKLCDRCGGRGNATNGPEVRTPAYDWQGNLDTAQIPIVRSGRHREEHT